MNPLLAIFHSRDKPKDSPQRQPLQLLFRRHIEREAGERNDRNADDGGVLLREDSVRNRRGAAAERL